MCSRYGWSAYENLSNDKDSRRSDDDNYLRLQKAIEYYKKAGEASTDKAFAAFCYRIAQNADETRNNLDYESSLTFEQSYDENKVKPAYTSPFRTKLKNDFSEFLDNLINDCGKLQEQEKKVRM
jgi:hypothetical protein